MKTKWHVIGRGLVGWHARGRGVSSSGGTLEQYLADAVNGALVYDASEADAVAFARLVISGPMVSADVGPDEIDRFSTSDRETLAGMMPGLEGGFRSIGTTTLAGLTSLDRVGSHIYRAMLREISGVRLGHVEGGNIIWEVR